MIILAIVTCVYVYKKKKSLIDSLVNVCYSRISYFILNLITVNMVIYTTWVIFYITALYLTAYSCDNVFDQSPECYEVSKVIKPVWAHYFVLRNMTLFITITQIYEWMTLRQIILWQSTKDMT